MINRNLIIKVLFALLLFPIYSCSKVNSSEENQVYEENRIMERSLNNGVFYLSHPKNQSILSADIIEVFLSGWEYEEEVTISGYTATDDLWTVLSIKSPESYFDLAKIELTYLKSDSQEWDECIEDICMLSQEIDNIIVLDQDLEVALVCIE